MLIGLLDDLVWCDAAGEYVIIGEAGPVTLTPTHGWPAYSTSHGLSQNER